MRRFLPLLAATLCVLVAASPAWGQSYDPSGALYVDPVNASGTPIGGTTDANIVKAAGTPLAAQPAAGVLPVGGARSITFGDGATNAPTDYSGAVAGYGYGYNGSTSSWDRIRAEGSGGNYAVRVSLYGSNQAGSVPGDSLLQTSNGQGDTLSNSKTGLLTVPYLMVFNGSAWDRLRTAIGTTGILATNTEGTKATYSSAATGVVPDTSATDVFTITGSASKTVRITRVSVSGIATAAGSYTVRLVSRSAANTGGTSTTKTDQPHDSASAAGTATVRAYTANPTLGSGAPVRASTITVSTSAAAIPVTPMVWDFTTRNEQAIVLRGTSQVLAVNLNGVTMTGGLLDMDVTWTEE